MFLLWEGWNGAARNNKIRRGFRLIWHAAVWSLWRARNDRIFNNSNCDVAEIVEAIKVFPWRWTLSLFCGITRRFLLFCCLVLFWGVFSGCGVAGDPTLNSYEEDCEFADPAGSFKGLQRFKRNCTNFGSLLEKSTMNLMKWEDFEDKGIGHWRFSCILSFPWKPILSGKSQAYPCISNRLSH
ncbi:putative NTF2-like domain-containing protein [Medicago truncatula]|uniref:Putative NTF2-like domain-containing protein n=1 Tax=Medicago truncatula TaxID=3880 RepID=A0A396I2P7_MEDTR|nr:putative NTF2-like domain-containing protein [Medicago truncatula]